MRYHVTVQFTRCTLFCCHGRLRILLVGWRYRYGWTFVILRVDSHVGFPLRYGYRLGVTVTRSLLVGCYGYIALLRY